MTESDSLKAALRCGSCNLCCFLLAIPDLKKPARQWCNDALRPHGGCAVHCEKSVREDLQACAQFECLWLQSQKQEDVKKRMPWNLRPNNSHVMFGPQDREDNTLLYVHVDPAHSDAWKHPDVAEYIEMFLARGAKLEIIVGDNVIKFPHEQHTDPG